MFIIGLYLICGAFAGILAGLFGVGGGTIFVPIMLYAFSAQGVSPEISHQLALGTSLATIGFTSLSSVLMHNKLGNVFWGVVFILAPGVLVGAFLGGQIVKYVPTLFLKWLFVIFMYFVVLQNIIDLKPKASRMLPRKIIVQFVGVFIGAFSTFVGVGGGILTVPFLVWCNVDMRKAVASSSTIGFCLAISGGISAMIAGWNIETLPEYSIGFVYLPSLLGMACASMVFAPFGAKLTQILPVKTLKKCFAGFLFLIATKMLLELL